MASHEPPQRGDYMSDPSLRAELHFVPINRDTIQERIYRQVADLILDGEVAPGQQVTIQRLTESFQVSATPVREALKRLAANGALTFVNGRAMGIPRIDQDRLDDLRAVRLEVESLAVTWAAERRTDAHLAAIRQEKHHLERAVADNDVSAYLRSNRAFHFAIYRASGSPTLVNIIENLWLQIGPYFNLLRESDNYASSNERHRAMWESIRARDAVAAREALAGDINGAYEIISRMLAS
jgi:DNA-binding GntR family transcriptional regulator